MPRPHLSTAARGYDAEHHRTTRHLKAALRDGDPCARCGRPMYRWQLALDRNDPQGIDGGHPDHARAGHGPPTGLEHRVCNRSAGASYGNRLRRRRAQPQQRVSRAW